MLYRAGGDALPAHIEEVYGIPVERVRELDLGVFRLERVDGLIWLARVFPSTRPVEHVEDDAALLRSLAEAGFPAERLAHGDPVSVHQGQGVLVTQFAPGAWHHLVTDGGLVEERAAALALLSSASPRAPGPLEQAYESLVEQLSDLDDLLGLPQGFAHPDLVPRNVVQGRSGQLTVVDWAGSGSCPRVAPLGCLLWSASGNPSHLEAAVSGYLSEVRPEPAEIERLKPAMERRPLILACWNFATGRSALADAVSWWQAERARLEAAALSVHRFLGA
jgi:hypothetical protein